MCQGTPRCAPRLFRRDRGARVEPDRHAVEFASRSRAHGATLGASPVHVARQVVRCAIGPAAGSRCRWWRLAGVSVHGCTGGEVLTAVSGAEGVHSLICSGCLLSQETGRGEPYDRRTHGIAPQHSGPDVRPRLAALTGIAFGHRAPRTGSGENTSNSCRDFGAPSGTPVPHPPASHSDPCGEGASRETLLCFGRNPRLKHPPFVTTAVRERLSPS